MKKHLLLLAFMAVSMFASAQFVGGNQNNSGKTMSTGDNNTWSSIRISYTPMTLDADGDLDDYYFDDDFDVLKEFRGLSGEFRTNFNIVKGMPIFLETGLGFSYASSKYQDDYEGSVPYYNDYYDVVYIDYTEEVKVKINFMSLYVPINIAYKFSINDQISIMPYLGLKARYNISAKMLEEYCIDFDEYYDDENESEEISLFDEDELEDWFEEDALKTKRFQLGWQIGADIQFNRFLVGFSYGSDIGEVMEDSKFKTTQISLGFVF